MVLIILTSSPSLLLLCCRTLKTVSSEPRRGSPDAILPPGQEDGKELPIHHMGLYWTLHDNTWLATANPVLEQQPSPSYLQAHDNSSSLIQMPRTFSADASNSSSDTLSIQGLRGVLRDICPTCLDAVFIELGHRKGLIESTGSCPKH